MANIVEGVDIEPFMHLGPKYALLWAQEKAHRNAIEALLREQVANYMRAQENYKALFEGSQADLAAAETLSSARLNEANAFRLAWQETSAQLQKTQEALAHWLNAIGPAEEMLNPQSRMAFLHAAWERMQASKP